MKLLAPTTFGRWVDAGWLVFLLLVTLYVRGQALHTGPVGLFPAAVVLHLFLPGVWGPVLLWRAAPVLYDLAHSPIRADLQTTPLRADRYLAGALIPVIGRVILPVAAFQAYLGYLVLSIEHSPGIDWEVIVPFYAGAVLVFPALLDILYREATSPARLWQCALRVAVWTGVLAFAIVCPMMVADGEGWALEDLALGMVAFLLFVALPFAVVRWRQLCKAYFAAR
ncbi:MAG: hypothetical protein KF858_01315 [Candidatus Sumerlaeia bacterium]|nr:hypothetical protein [Candidatus Sumerlaeia bacterium]